MLVDISQPSVLLDVVSASLALHMNDSRAHCMSRCSAVRDARQEGLSWPGVNTSLQGSPGGPEQRSVTRCSSLLSAEVCDLGCCRNGPLDPALEVSKKGTLKLDLQALTVGVAVLSMHHWLVQLRPQLASEPAAGPEASRKLAVVNGMGENNRTQVRHRGPTELLPHHWCLCAAPGPTGSVL